MEEIGSGSEFGSVSRIPDRDILKNIGSFTLNHYQELRLLHTGGPAGAAAAGEGAAGGLQRTGRGSGAQPQQQRGAAARQRRGGERAGQPPAACSGQVDFFSHCQVVLGFASLAGPVGLVFRGILIRPDP
jgi:hypothetical protein